MAKHRRTGKFVVFNVDQSVVLGTLGAGTIGSSAVTGLGVTRVKIISVDLMYSLTGFTSGEGPIVVGIANGDLSNTEIGEALDAQPTSQTDIIANERRRRPVRRMGVFSGVAVSETLNDGKAIRQKLFTTLDEGTELLVWARNQDTSALTTGATVDVFGKVYAEWM